jgi:hypothetical protein
MLPHHDPGHLRLHGIDPPSLRLDLAREDIGGGHRSFGRCRVARKRHLRNLDNLRPGQAMGIDGIRRIKIQAEESEAHI